MITFILDYINMKIYQIYNFISFRRSPLLDIEDGRMKSYNVCDYYDEFNDKKTL